MPDEPQVPAPLAGQAAEIPSTRANIQIRTQATDVESLKQTGGAYPLPETVSVNTSETVTPAPQTGIPEQPSPAPAEIAPIPIAKSKKSFTWVFVVIGIVILFLVGYFIIPLFFG